MDDDADVRSAIGELVSCTCGAVAVVTARNGAEALDLLRRGLRPCRILTDLRMPFMSGEALIEALCSGEFGDIPVITMTATFETPSRQPGAAVQLTKPFTIVQLERALAITASGECSFRRVERFT